MVLVDTLILRSYFDVLDKLATIHLGTLHIKLSQLGKIAAATQAETAEQLRTNKTLLTNRRKDCSCITAAGNGLAWLL